VRSERWIALLVGSLCAIGGLALTVEASSPPGVTAERFHWGGGGGHGERPPASLKNPPGPP
jgi:hypothetical protein